MLPETIVAIGALALGGPSASAIHEPPPGQRSDPVAVIERVLEAHGGADRIRAVEGFRQEGMLVARMGGAHATVFRISEGAERLSVLVRYPDRDEIRILEDGSGWRGATPATIGEVAGPLLGAMILQGARASVLSVLDEQRTAAVLEEGPDGVTVVRVALSESLALRVFVDDDTDFVARTESILAGMPARAGFATNYSDYRVVDGVVFAFHEETFASGVHTASVMLESVELNPEGNQALLPVGRR